MKLNWVERYVLDLAAEDWTPISDVFVAVRDAEPGKTDDHYLERAHRIVRRFLKLRYIQLCRVDHAGMKRSVSELTREQISAELSKVESWLPAERLPDSQICISAIREGKMALRNTGPQ